MYLLSFQINFSFIERYLFNCNFKMSWLNIEKCKQIAVAAANIIRPDLVRAKVAAISIFFLFKKSNNYGIYNFWYKNFF